MSRLAYDRFTGALALAGWSNVTHRAQLEAPRFAFHPPHSHCVFVFACRWPWIMYACIGVALGLLLVAVLFLIVATVSAKSTASRPFVSSRKLRCLRAINCVVCPIDVKNGFLCFFYKSLKTCFYVFFIFLCFFCVFRMLCFCCCWNKNVQKDKYDAFFMGKDSISWTEWVFCSSIIDFILIRRPINVPTKKHVFFLLEWIL